MEAINLAKEQQNPELCSEHLYRAYLNDSDFVTFLDAETNKNAIDQLIDDQMQRLTKSNSDNISLNRYVYNSFNKKLTC